MSVLGSKRSDIKRSPRRLFRYRSAGSKGQAPPPKLPRALTDPSWLGPKHSLYQTMRTESPFKAPHVLKRGQAHCLRENSVVRSRLRTYWVPPKKLSLQLRRKVRRKIMCARYAHA